MEQNERGVILGLIASAKASLDEAVRRLEASPQSGAAEPKTNEDGSCAHPLVARKTITTMGAEVEVCMACGLNLEGLVDDAGPSA